MANESALASYLKEKFPHFGIEMPDHWLHAGVLQEDTSLWLAFLLVIIILVSYGVNGLWFLMFASYKSLRTPANLLVASLFMADLLMMSKSWIFVLNIASRGPYFGDIGCYCFASLGTVAGLVQIWTITAISAERALVISQSYVKANGRLSHATVSIMILCVWILATIFAVLPLFGWSRYVAEAYAISCNFDTWSTRASSRLFMAVLMIMGYVIPLGVIVFCYALIFAFTRRTRQEVCGNTDRNRKHLKKLMTEKRLALTTVFIVAIWVLTWTPFAVISLIQLCGYGNLVSPMASVTAIFFTKCSSIINAFIYGLRLPQFRHLLRECWRGKTSNSSGQPLGHASLRFYRRPARNMGTREGVPRRDTVEVLDKSGKVVTTVQDSSRLTEASLALQRECIFFEEWMKQNEVKQT